VGYGVGHGALNRSTLSFASARNRARLRRGLAYYEQEIVRYRDELRRDGSLAYLSLLITGSPAYNMTRRDSFLHSVGEKLQMFELLTADSLVRLMNEGIHLMSMVFGDTVGALAIRGGRLRDRPEVLADLNAALQAGDILLERTPFRLTDALIPGHFGHAALWIGTEPELRALGIWDHPVVAARHNAIRESRQVAEALRYGVALNSLRQFLDVDDIAVLRFREIEPAHRAEAVIQALRQIGKRYDFNFDVETTDRIVCSELVYLAYGGRRWPAEVVLGRATLSPDQIAAEALPGGSLFVVRLYHAGKKVTDDPTAQLARLLERQAKPRTPAPRPAAAGTCR
jgi:hypothetical protein